MMTTPGKVLLIEDTLSTIQMVSDTLAAAGHTVYVANNGEKGITRAVKVMPELIILDVMMPGIDGYETCRRLKEIPELVDIPVIFSSALRESIDKVKAFNLGAIDYVPKPIEPAELIERVNTHLSLYRLRHNLEQEVESRTEQLKRKNEELVTAWEKAEESSRTKEEFLSVLSHELRTPLNPVVSYSSILLSEVTDPEHLEMLESINSGALHMNGLVSDLLNYASKEAAETKVCLEDFDLLKLLNDCVAYFRQLAQDKAFEFHLETATDLPTSLRTDKIRLWQILHKLLSNAFKFCNAGKVSLSCHLDNGTQPGLVFRVSDTGIGIPKDKQQSVFQPFYQGDTSSTREYPGVGLGLSIARRMAEKLQGRLTLESEQGFGTHVSLYLPLQAQ
jgi:two-component system sensor histidine kinase/response regulator